MQIQFAELSNEAKDAVRGSIPLPWRLASIWPTRKAAHRSISNWRRLGFIAAINPVWNYGGHLHVVCVREMEQHDLRTGDTDTL